MMKIITSPWDQEFERFVCSARVSLRVAAPYYGLRVIESIMEKSGPKVRKSFLLALSDAGVRAGSQSAAAIMRLINAPRCAVRLGIGLHAKFAIADERTAIVTSSNFTEAGLFSNVELGVLIDEPRFVRALLKEFDARFEEGGVPSARRIKRLCRVQAMTRPPAAGNSYGNRLRIVRSRLSRPSASRQPAMGWILVHSEDKFGGPGQDSSPQEELDAMADAGSIPGDTWNWNAGRPPRTGGPRTLLMSWKGHVFAECMASVEHLRKSSGGAFRFRLESYEPYMPLRLTKLLPGDDRARYHRGLIRLDQRISDRYRKLTRGSR